MYLLIGKLRAFGLDEEDVVAKFTTLKSAKNYEKASRLKGSIPQGKLSPYRQSSLLRGYTHAFIEKEDLPDYVPVDPKLD